MSIVRKMLLVSIVTGIFGEGGLNEIEAVTINGASYDFSNDTVPVAENFAEPYATNNPLLVHRKISGLDNWRETFSISGNLNGCDLNLQHCGVTPADVAGAPVSTATKMHANAGRTAGGTTEIPESTALLLLILGFIGLSRLRGRPIK